MKKIILAVVLLLVLFGAYFMLPKKIAGVGHLQTNEDMKIESEKSIEEKLLEGEWQSIDDNSFVRKFNGDETFKDSYSGEGVTSSGTWFVFDSSEKPEYFQYPVEVGKKYIIINDTNVSLSFLISEVNEDYLSLIYLDNGGMLQFKKIN